MGVIRWEKDADGKWQGWLGWSHVATAGRYTAPDGSDIYALTTLEDFPGFKTFVDPYESIDACKGGAEELIQEWMDEAGLMSAPKPKQRTETDFRNADIDQRGYVTFRDGGAA